MAGLKTVIFTNGVVQSTYDDGTPADMFSGKLPILNTIFIHLDNKDLLPRDLQVKSIKFYIANDPLCEHYMEVTTSYLKHMLQYIKHDVLEKIPITQIEDINVNNLIDEANRKAELELNNNKTLL